MSQTHGNGEYVPRVDGLGDLVAIEISAAADTSALEDVLLQRRLRLTAVEASQHTSP